MRKKILVALVVVFIIGAAYAVLDYQKIKKMGQETDMKWTQVEGRYGERILEVEKLNQAVKAASLPEPKTLEKLEKALTAYAKDGTAQEKVSSADKIEVNAAKIAASLEKYPEIKNLPEVSAALLEFQNGSQKASEWKKAYNDSSVFFNTQIRRIRHRFVASIFSIAPRGVLKSNSEIEKNIKAANDKAGTTPSQ